MIIPMKDEGNGGDLHYWVQLKLLHKTDPTKELNNTIILHQYTLTGFMTFILDMPDDVQSHLDIRIKGRWGVGESVFCII